MCIWKFDTKIILLACCRPPLKSMLCLVLMHKGDRLKIQMPRHSTRKKTEQCAQMTGLDIINLPLNIYNPRKYHLTFRIEQLGNTKSSKVRRLFKPESIPQTDKPWNYRRFGHAFYFLAFKCHCQLQTLFQLAKFHWNWKQH